MSPSVIPLLIFITGQTMKNHSIANWVELKKQTRHFETVLNCKRILKRTTEWNNMATFFKEADKHIK